MKNHKQLLMDFYLELLKAPEAGPNYNFNNLKYEVLDALSGMLDEDRFVVQRIFERMAAEDIVSINPIAHEQTK